MRIISQNGRFDLPYEKCIIWVHDNKITVCPIRETDSEYTFEIYSTSKKAEKVMEMLHKAYIGMPIVFKNVELDDTVKNIFSAFDKTGIILQPLEDARSEVECVNNIIFQFPKDDEVQEE